MRNLKRILAVPLLLTCGVLAQAQTRSVSETAITQIAAQPPTHGQGKGEAVLIAGPERRALQVLMKSVQNQITSAAGAMPADKYGFAPTDGEFKGVRTFGQQVKHLAATNHILAAAALGEEPPIDAGDEMGPDAVRTKAEVLDYLNESFVHLGKAIDAIGDQKIAVKSSPISPLQRQRGHAPSADGRSVDSCV